MLLSDKHRRSGDPCRDSEEDTVATFDTCYEDGDFDEYLVDATNGMEREWEVDDEGAVLTPPRLVRRIQNPYKKTLQSSASVELKKRKTPDGGDSLKPG